MAKTRGTAILQLVKMLRSQREAAERILDPALHHYLSDEISRVNWYPEEEYLALITAAVRLIPDSKIDVWEAFGRAAANHDLTTVYRGMVVRNRGLLEALKSMKDIFHLYHDTGHMVISGDEQRATADLLDYASVSAGHCRFLDGYLREHLKISLGRELDVREIACTAGGAAQCRRVIQA